MNIHNLKKAQLVELAAYLGVEHDEKINVSNLKALIQEGADDELIANGIEDLFGQALEGVTDATDEEHVHHPMSPESEAIAKVKEAVQQVLVKFTGSNTSYATGKHKFSQQKPFAVVSAAEAERLLKKSNFEEATAEEVKRFYR